LVGLRAADGERHTALVDFKVSDAEVRELVGPQAERPEHEEQGVVSQPRGTSACDRFRECVVLLLAEHAVCWPCDVLRNSMTLQDRLHALAGDGAVVDLVGRRDASEEWPGPSTADVEPRSDGSNRTVLRSALQGDLEGVSTDHALGARELDDVGELQRSDRSVPEAGAPQRKERCVSMLCLGVCKQCVTDTTEMVEPKWGCLVARGHSIGAPQAAEQSVLG